MSKDHYVYSTLSAPQEYVTYNSGAADLPQAVQSVFIAGGANVAGKHLVTPLGVVTKVTDEELKALETNEVFKLHKENGFVTVSDAKVDPEVVAADMTSRDEAAPLVDGDFDPNSADAKPAGLNDGGAQKGVKPNPRKA